MSRGDPSHDLHSAFPGTSERPAHDPNLSAPALEKLRMHWTSHMDQYDILSHPQDQSPLPYLISSQPTNDPLPLRRSPPRPGPDPLAASLVPPTETRSAQHQWSTGVPAYGKDPSWRSQQISFLHAEQKRHTGKFEPPLMSDDYATSSGRSAQYPQAEHAPRLVQYATGDGMQRSVSDSRKRKSDSDHQERRGRASQEHSCLLYTSDAADE